MFVHKKFAKAVTGFKSLTDSEFIEWQIWQLCHVFGNELAAIKNSLGQYIAYTDNFAKEFGVNSELLGNTALEITPAFSEAYPEICRQEREIIKTATTQRSFYVFKKNNKVNIYSMYKCPLINPATNKVVGLFILTSMFRPNQLRKVVYEQYFKMHQQEYRVQRYKLSHLQKQILFCLLLGYTSRKELTIALANFADKDYNEARVKNTLQALYKKFQCNTTGQLIDLVVTGQVYLDVPDEILPAGIFPVK